MDPHQPILRATVRPSKVRGQGVSPSSLPARITVLSNMLLKHWRCPQSQATPYKAGMFFRWQKAHPTPAIIEPQVRHRYLLCWEAMGPVHPQLTAQDALPSLASLLLPLQRPVAGVHLERKFLLFFLLLPTNVCLGNRSYFCRSQRKGNRGMLLPAQCFSLIHLQTLPLQESS